MSDPSHAATDPSQPEQPVLRSASAPQGWASRWERLVGMLTTREDPGEGATSSLQLSLLGHAALTTALFLGAGVAFVANMEFTRSVIHQWDLCDHSSGPNSVPSSQEAGGDDWKQSQQALTQAINNLTAATPPQRSRLLEQHHEIRGVMNSYCLISHNFEIQFSSFTFVGTAAAILVTICLASVAPDGLKTKNRALLNLMMTSSIILAISVVYPQTFSQKSNQTQARSVYMQASNLLRLINSALANQQIASDPKNPKASTPLNSPETVAIFIRMNDNALIQLTSSRVSINNDFASRTFTQIKAGENPPAGSPSPSEDATSATTGSQAAVDGAPPSP